MVARFYGLPLIALVIALLVTLGIAFIPPADYSRYIALRTATLLAIITYAYFTFRSVRPEAYVQPESGARVTFHGLGEKYPAKFRLAPAVTNPTERRLFVRFYVGLTIDDERIPLEGFYNGGTWVPVGAKRRVQGNLTFEEDLDWAEREDGNKEIANEKALVSMKVEWVDDLCERGESMPLYWKIDFSPEEGVTSVIDPERQSKLFPEEHWRERRCRTD